MPYSGIARHAQAFIFFMNDLNELRISLCIMVANLGRSIQAAVVHQDDLLFLKRLR